MRRSSAIIVLLAILVLLVGAVGCGDKSTAGPAGDNPTPAELLTAIVSQSANMTSATGSFDVAITIDADTSKMSEEEKAMLGSPIQVSGTFASGNEPLGAEANISMSLAGQTMQVGFKTTGDKTWFALAGQWYETPPDMQFMAGQDVQTEDKSAEIMQLITDLGVDPLTWMPDLKIAGEETIDGAATYHLTGTPDVVKIIADAIGLMQSKELMALIDPSGSMSGMMESGTMLPRPDELQEMQTQVAEMFKDMALDLWVDKATSLPRKMAVTANITPPPGEDADGLNSIGFTLTILLQNLNQPVTVEAPASALPFTEFEKALQENPALLGPLSGALGGMPTF
ncbi:MAG: hypothetical protein A2133_04660 [Actinobacteria bacterium RBG_16_64_13]|nr:MAG: hypothetical protein A2133_04660 [Actinobacteria bacterium RBG_16_64_13]